MEFDRTTYIPMHHIDRMPRKEACYILKRRIHRLIMSDVWKIRMTRRTRKILNRFYSL